MVVARRVWDKIAPKSTSTYERQNKLEIPDKDMNARASINSRPILALYRRSVAGVRTFGLLTLTFLNAV